MLVHHLGFTLLQTWIVLLYLRLNGHFFPMGRWVLLLPLGFDDDRVLYRGSSCLFRSDRSCIQVDKSALGAISFLFILRFWSRSLDHRLVVSSVGGRRPYDRPKVSHALIITVGTSYIVSFVLILTDHIVDFMLNYALPQSFDSRWIRPFRLGLLGFLLTGPERG